MTALDENALNRSYRHEIGKKRPDGKYNVWERKFLFSPHQADWVIVYVGRNWRDARDWVIAEEKTDKRRAA